VTSAITHSRIRALGYGLVLLAIFTATAEMTARIQDRLVEGTPIAAVPDPDRDLFVDTPTGRRGRPNGRYLKWTLNEYGFRSAAMSHLPAAGKQRLMLLGSSETFGLHESPGREFPAILADTLRGRYEVVNAALSGMTLSSTLPYWNGWARQFAPQVVVIYPSPFFYLNGPDRPVQPQDAEGRDKTRSAETHNWRQALLRTAASLRLVQRARERLDVPDVIQRWRDQRNIRVATEGKPAGWVFSTPPASRADRLIHDLAGLVAAVRQDGARPIVMTHGSRVLDPPRPQDLDWLERARVNTPRAEARVIAQFETLVNAKIIDWARREQVEVIDLRAVIGGREELFGDLIHFNDAGAAVVSAAIADYLDKSEPGHRQVSRTIASHAVQ
jgi:hypothetical protein